MGFPRAGSNPAGCELFFSQIYLYIQYVIYKNIKYLIMIYFLLSNEHIRWKNVFLFCKKLNKICLPPVRFELTTPGLRDQCSTTELKRLGTCYGNNSGSATKAVVNLEFHFLFLNVFLSSLFLLLILKLLY